MDLQGSIGTGPEGPLTGVVGEWPPPSVRKHGHHLLPPPPLAVDHNLEPPPRRC